MSEELYVLTLCLPLGTILIVFGMRYVSALLQARARLASDGEYRLIAEKAVAAQSATAGALLSLEVATADIRLRVSAIEKVLKDVG